jgi:hypothetical protein
MTETYSKSVDFGGQLAAGQFHTEIEDEAGITTTLLRVDVNSDVVNVVFESTISAGEKTTLDTLVSNHTPNPTNSIISVPGNNEITSTLADAASIIINASNAAGGIDIDAGTGGIAIDTTNSISLDAAAASNFTTTSGNLTLDATVGLVNIDGGSGINIGTQAEAQPINIGTAAAARTITMGNQTGASQTDVRAGTGGFNLDVASGGGISLDSTGASSNWTLATTGDAQDLTIALTGSNNSSIIIDSQGTGSDSIRLNAAGGIDVDVSGSINITTTSTSADAVRILANTGAGGLDLDLGTSGLDLDTNGPINLATSEGAGGSITLDAATNNGGVTISSGSQGIAINSGTGLIGIGHWSAGNMDIGTSATARTITIGNTTGATSIVINSGTGGITIGNNSNGGEIQIGDVAQAKTLTIGNNTGATRLFTRWGTGGLVKSQPAATAYSDANQTATIGELQTGILTMTPTADRTVTLPTAANAVSGISGVEVGDCIDFHIINEDTSGNEHLVTVAAGTGGTVVGNPDVNPRNNVNLADTYKCSGGSHWRLRFTNVTASSEAYTVYHIS